MAPTLLDLPTSLNTLRYAAPIKQGGQARAKVEADPRNPAHWDNARLRTWVTEASRGAVNPDQLCPWESGRQLLRIPETEFLRRICQANPKVSFNNIVVVMIMLLRWGPRKQRISTTCCGRDWWTQGQGRERKKQAGQ